MIGGLGTRLESREGRSALRELAVDEGSRDADERDGGERLHFRAVDQGRFEISQFRCRLEKDSLLVAEFDERTGWYDGKRDCPLV